MLSWLSAVLLALALIAPASPARADDIHPEWGSTARHDGVLRPGCHGYTFHYAVTPPTGIWALETFLSGPAPYGTGRVNLAHNGFLDGYDPKTGIAHFTLCRSTTRYGTFIINAKLSVQNGPDEYVEGYLPPATFTLHKPRHHRHHHHR